MKAVIHINGVVGEDVFLKDVIRQFKSFKNAKEVEVLIDSPGGGVDEGVSIYNYLRKLDLPITTKGSRCYSIAASVFMAGDVRLLEEGSNRFMIHMPWGAVQGGADTFESAAQVLREIEDELVEFYSKYTEIDHDSIRRLLKNETFLTAQEAVDMGMATGTYTTMKAVAFYSEEDNNNNQTKNVIMTKAQKLADALASFFTGDVEQPQMVALVIQDANGEEINFPELDENESPEAGAKILKDGEPFTGEVLLPDGSKIIAEDGVVGEVIPAPEEEQEAEEAPEEEVQASDEKEEKEETEVQASEETEVKVEEEIDFKALLNQFTTQLREEIRAEFTERETELKEEIRSLKKEIGSEISNEPSEVQKPQAQGGSFLTRALQNKRK